MADSFSKKEKAKKKSKKKEDKAQKKEERKSSNNKGKGFESMLAYIDENGNLTDTPPDTRNRIEIDLNDIQLGAAPIVQEDPTRTGVVSFFSDKGFGFIIDDRNQNKVFVHANQLSEPIKEGDKVSFENERSPKGMVAVNVNKIKN